VWWRNCDDTLSLSDTIPERDRQAVYRVVIVVIVNLYSAFMWSRVSCVHNTSRASIVTPYVTLKSGLEVSQCHWKWRRSTDCIYEFLLAFHNKYGAILYRFQDIASYWLKTAKCFIANLYLASPAGMTPSKMFYTHKTRMIVLSCGEEIVTIY